MVDATCGAGNAHSPDHPILLTLGVHDFTYSLCIYITKYVSLMTMYMYE